MLKHTTSCTFVVVCLFVVQAMSYLYKQGFPQLGCIHTGNIFVYERPEEVLDAIEMEEEEREGVEIQRGDETGEDSTTTAGSEKLTNGDAGVEKLGEGPIASEQTTSIKETGQEVRRSLEADLEAEADNVEEGLENGGSAEEGKGPNTKEDLKTDKDYQDGDLPPDEAAQSGAVGNDSTSSKFGSKMKNVKEKAKGAMAGVKDKAASVIKKVEEQGKLMKTKAEAVVKRKLTSSAEKAESVKGVAYTGRLFCRLSGYENILLGYKSNCYQGMSSAGVLDRMDLVMFGHVIYEMATGCPVPSNCSVVDLGVHLDEISDDVIRKDLRTILKMELEDTGYTGAVEKVEGYL